MAYTHALFLQMIITATDNLWWILQTEYLLNIPNKMFTYGLKLVVKACHMATFLLLNLTCAYNMLNVCMYANVLLAYHVVCTDSVNLCTYVHVYI